MKQRETRPDGPSPRRAIAMLLSPWLVTSFMLAALPHEVFATGTYDTEAIDSFLQSEMAALEIPGLAVAIVDGDTIAHIRGFGVAGPDGRPVTPQTPFLIASTSKAFTALAVMQLVEAGRLNLDLTVRSYLPWFTTSDRELSGRITVRELLNQTSGLSTVTGNSHDFDDDSGAGALERAVRSLASESLVSSPGAQFHYSNANYLVLGLLVQDASGQDFGTYLHDHIFLPLDMRHTYTSESKAKADGLASGYYHWFGLASVPTDFPHGTANLPAAGIMSSAEDMAHALIAHLNNGRYLDRAVLSAAGMETLHRGAASIGDANKYAMGWYVGPLYVPPELASDGASYTLPLLLAHVGDAPNYHSVVVMLPGLRRGAVLLMNTNDYAIPGRFARMLVGIEDLLTGQPPVSPDAIPDNPLVKYGRLLLALAVLLQLTWMGSWLAMRRRSQPVRSRRRRMLLASLTVAGLAADIGTVLFLWLMAPGMFDDRTFVFIRGAPDVGLMIAAFTLLTVIWVAVRGSVAASPIAAQKRDHPRGE